MLCGADALGAAHPRPILVVFDFESAFDEGRLGRKVAVVFRGHAFRRRVYLTIHDIDLESTLDARPFQAKFDMAPEKIAQYAGRNFEATVVIWGRVTHERGDKYRVFVRAVDLRKARDKLALDTDYKCNGLHTIPQNVDAALNALQGITKDQEEDLLADTSWKTRANLVGNPGFEEGKDDPDHWERTDGLTTFWVSGKSPAGKCVMIDTDVLESQFRAWRKNFDRGAPRSQAPKKLPTKPPKYNTVGGTCGSHLYSDWIPIEQGVVYRQDIDVKGRRGNAKIFTKGYALINDPELGPQRREIYRAPIHLHMETDNKKWEHFAKVFHPTQPLILLHFSSDFDKGETGRRILNLLLAEAKARGVLSMRDPKKVEAAIRKHGFEGRVKAPKVEVHHFVSTRVGVGVAIWGEVFPLDKGCKIYVCGMDVRPKTITKEWRESFDCKNLADLKETCRKIAGKIFHQAYPVRWLRVKLDAYWPPGLYHFDNVCITEENAGP